jgi:hypothetical protein
MTSTGNQSTGHDAPHRLREPDLAAWAEKMTIGSAGNKRGIWYGALLFWIVVACIVAARIAFLDVSRIPSASTSSATHSTLAGGATSAPHETKL